MLHVLNTLKVLFLKKISYFWKSGLWALLSLLFVVITVVVILYAYAQSQLPDVASLKTIELQVPLQIFTKDGLLIQEYGEKRRIPIPYDQIPPTLVHAVLATEDQRFFEHPGVDIMGLGRAAISMIQTHRKSQGGSTITMQVARNFFLNSKKTFLRKFNEIMLAIKIDQELSKEKILELYLNQIYLGNRAYGVGAAAQVYYGKALQDLNIAQLAMIAGLPQAPSSHNPIINPLAAKKRRDHVLERLYEEKYISKEQYQEALQQPLTEHYHGTHSEVYAPYVAEMIRLSLVEHFGQEAYTRGYKVYTTVDSRLQTTANHVTADHLLAYDRRHGYRGPIGKISPFSSPSIRNQKLHQYAAIGDLQPVVILTVDQRSATAVNQKNQTLTLAWDGISWARPELKKGFVGRAPTSAHNVLAVGDVVYVTCQQEHCLLSQNPDAEVALVALNPKDGGIEALVGGFNFGKSKFNRATQSERQPGSSFKPFLYAAALNKGYTLATVINDAPIVIRDPSQPEWRPHNDNLKFGGPTRLKTALTLSRNLVSIRILDDIGVEYTIDYATRFGFRKETFPHTLSLALGTLSVTPMDLTAAYAIFANGGYKVEPYLIDRITNTKGHVLLQAKPTQAPTEQTEISADVLAPRVISAETAFLMNTALQNVIQHGTASAARVLNRQDIAGKTGTTNDQMDAWFAGYNRDLVVTTWIGFDNPQPLHEYAAGLALPVWIDFMKPALHGKPEHSLTEPPGIVSLGINPDNGLRARPNQINTITEYFMENELPPMDEEQSSSPGNPHDTEENLF
ncbi:MAG: penicillin-binding protein 1A [Legionellaceae bacterium]|nr:penicillin-binding protein 1A [Legionellaceae bacterium]MBP9774859.1 penicillin-binding protein 1A [Legionellaceae bacterium]